MIWLEITRRGHIHGARPISRVPLRDRVKCWSTDKLAVNLYSPYFINPLLAPRPEHRIAGTDMQQTQSNAPHERLLQTLSDMHMHINSLTTLAERETSTP